jgi:hypothetical protein
VHPVVHPAGAGFLPQAQQVGGRRVDGGHLCLGEACRQRERAGAGPAAQVHDVPGVGRERQPRDDGLQVLGEHVRVQVEDLGLVGVVGLAVAVAVAVSVSACGGRGVVRVMRHAAKRTCGMRFRLPGERAAGPGRHIPRRSLVIVKQMSRVCDGNRPPAIVQKARRA